MATLQGSQDCHGDHGHGDGRRNSQPNFEADVGIGCSKKGTKKNANNHGTHGEFAGGFLGRDVGAETVGHEEEDTVFFFP
jgi:hypothetical protein